MEKEREGERESCGEFCGRRNDRLRTVKGREIKQLSGLQMSATDNGTRTSQNRPQISQTRKKKLRKREKINLHVRFINQQGRKIRHSVGQTERMKGKGRARDTERLVVQFVVQLNQKMRSR